jgi:hypothetical protein
VLKSLNSLTLACRTALCQKQASACMHRTELPRWCKAFEACDAREVAIVGNGPLSAQQRSELNSGRFQVVLRFNFLNNRCIHAKQLPVHPLHQARALPILPGLLHRPDLSLRQAP